MLHVDAEVIVHVLAHAGKIVHDGYSELGQALGVADTGQLQ